MILIADGVINLSDYTAATTIITDNPSQIAGASVTVVVTPSTTGYVVKVEANAGNETYLVERCTIFGVSFKTNCAIFINVFSITYAMRFYLYLAYVQPRWISNHLCVVKTH